MKKIIVSIGWSILHLSIYAQSKESGIYLTQDDFERGKLSYNTNHPSDRNKIYFNEFLNKPFITVKSNGEKTVIFKDEIFAYKKKRTIVRTCNFVSYNLAEKGAIWVYFRDMNVLLGKGIKRERKYYYSVSGQEKIIPLTIYNLKRSFPGKVLFHQFLDAQFRSDSDLSSYDGFQNKLKVNQLLETTVFENEISVP